MQKTIKGSEQLGKKIKKRREELNLTIEEAASRANVGTKTWYRYESGESIRKDKCRGICKALNWRVFPDQDETDGEILIQKYKEHPNWSTYLEEQFGNYAALSFAVGCDLLYDSIREDMEALSALPVGTHIGQLDVSWMKDSLPPQFLMHYDYEFLYQMFCTLQHMIQYAKHGTTIIAQSVMEELIIYLCNEEGIVFIEMDGKVYGEEFRREDLEEWVFDLFGDSDLITFLYSNIYLDKYHTYHFSHWTDLQFYVKS